MAICFAGAYLRQSYLSFLLLLAVLFRIYAFVLDKQVAGYLF